MRSTPLNSSQNFGNNSSEEKTKLRLHFKELAKEFFATHDADALAKIHKHIAREVEVYIKSYCMNVHTIAIYKPMRYELPVREILQQVSSLIDSDFLYPEINGQDMEFVSEKTGQATDPDLVIVPGLFVDGMGYRLGRGKGYYDRYLAKSKLARPYHLFLGYAFQFVHNVPKEQHDEIVSFCGGV